MSAAPGRLHWAQLLQGAATWQFCCRIGTDIQLIGLCNAASTVCLFNSVVAMQVIDLTEAAAGDPFPGVDRVASVRETGAASEPGTSSSAAAEGSSAIQADGQPPLQAPSQVPTQARVPCLLYDP